MNTGGMLVATASYKSQRQLLLLLFPGAGQRAGVPESPCSC